jgi:hypothetical protein
MTTLREKRLRSWDGVPHGSRLFVKVTDGDYGVGGEGVLEAPGERPKEYRLSFEELAKKEFDVELSAGGFFRLIVTITYVLPETRKATVTARVITPAGILHQGLFGCDYEGSSEGTSREDTVTFIATGEE